MADRFARLPELLHVLSEHVPDRQTLQSLVLVNHDFHQVFSVKLWGWMHCDLNNVTKWLDESKRSRFKYSKNMVHMRSLVMYLDTWWEPRDMDNDEDGLTSIAVKINDAITDIVRHCPQLERFEARNMLISHDLMEALVARPGLSDLRIVFSRRMERFLEIDPDGMPAEKRRARDLRFGHPERYLGRLMNLRRLDLGNIWGDVAQWRDNIVGVLLSNPKLEHLDLGLAQSAGERLMIEEASSIFTEFFSSVCEEYGRHRAASSGAPEQVPLMRIKWLNLRRGFKFPDLETLRLALDLTAIEGTYVYNHCFEWDFMLEPAGGWVDWEVLSYDAMPALHYLFITIIDSTAWKRLPSLVRSRAKAAGGPLARGLLGFHAHLISDALVNQWKRLPEPASLYQFQAQMGPVPMFAIPDSAREPGNRPIPLHHLKNCHWITHLGISPVGWGSSRAPDSWLPLLYEVLTCLEKLQALWMPISDRYSYGGDLDALAYRIAVACPSLTYIRLGPAGSSWRVRRPLAEADGKCLPVMKRRQGVEDEQGMPEFFSLCTDSGKWHE